MAYDRGYGENSEYHWAYAECGQNIVPNPAAANAICVFMHGLLPREEAYSRTTSGARQEALYVRATNTKG